MTPEQKKDLLSNLSPEKSTKVETASKWIKIDLPFKQPAFIPVRPTDPNSYESEEDYRKYVGEPSHEVIGHFRTKALKDQFHEKPNDGAYPFSAKLFNYLDRQ